MKLSFRATGNNFRHRRQESRQGIQAGDFIVAESVFPYFTSLPYTRNLLGATSYGT